jgi:hypothetical protein
MFYKTNAALGHREWAYFLKLNPTDYLCIFKDYTDDKDTLLGGHYTVGEIESGFESYEIESTNFDINKSEMNKDLLEILIEKVEKKKETPVIQERFMDQLDGNVFADKFITDIYNELSSKTPHLDIEYRNLARDQHIVDGQIITLWLKEKIIATANVMRTPMNWTHVVCQKIPENIEY